LETKKGHRPAPREGEIGGLSVCSFLKPWRSSHTSSEKRPAASLKCRLLRRKTDFLIKPVFLTFFSEKANKYVKTPHFRAEFSVLHLSSTHSGTPDWIRTSGL
jgi:hypothetical protein